MYLTTAKTSHTSIYKSGQWFSQISKCMHLDTVTQFTEMLISCISRLCWLILSMSLSCICPDGGAQNLSFLAGQRSFQRQSTLEISRTDLRCFCHKFLFLCFTARFDPALARAGPGGSSDFNIEQRWFWQHSDVLQRMLLCAQHIAWRRTQPDNEIAGATTATLVA